MKVDEILDLLGAPMNGGRRGRVMFFQRAVERDPQLRTGAIHKMLEQLLDQPTGVEEHYVHPASRVRLEVGPRGDTTRPLTEADLEYLRRLPPASEVTFEQSVQLARFASQVPPRTPDARLVHEIWEPVRHRHDLAAARAELHNANRPAGQLPPSAAAAIAEAVSRETTELRPDECGYRARELLHDVTQKRTEQHQARREQAQSHVEQLVKQDADRRSLTAPHN